MDIQQIRQQTIFQLLTITHNSQQPQPIKQAQTQLQNIFMNHRYLQMLPNMLQDLHIQHNIKLGIVCCLNMLIRKGIQAITYYQHHHECEQYSQSKVNSIYFVTQNIINNKHIPYHYKQQLTQSYIRLYMGLQRSVQTLFIGIINNINNNTHTRTLVGASLLQQTLHILKRQYCYTYHMKALQVITQSLLQNVVHIQIQMQNMQIQQYNQSGKESVDRLWECFRLICSQIHSCEQLGMKICNSPQVHKLLTTIWNNRHIVNNNIYYQSLMMTSSMLQYQGRRNIHNHIPMPCININAIHDEQVGINAVCLYHIQLIKYHHYHYNHINMQYIQQRLCQRVHNRVHSTQAYKQAQTCICDILSECRTGYNIQQCTYEQVSMSILLRTMYAHNQEYQLSVNNTISQCFHYKDKQNRIIVLLIVLHREVLKNKRLTELVVNYIIQTQKVFRLLHLYLLYTYLDEIQAQMIDTLIHQINGHCQNGTQKRMMLCVYVKAYNINHNTQYVQQYLHHIQVSQIQNVRLVQRLVQQCGCGRQVGSMILEKVKEIRYINCIPIRYEYYKIMNNIIQHEQEGQYQFEVQLQKYVGTQLIACIQQDIGYDEYRQLVSQLVYGIIHKYPHIQINPTHHIINSINIQMKETYNLIHAVIINYNQQHTLMSIIDKVLFQLSNRMSVFLQQRQQVSITKLLLLLHSSIYYHHHHIVCTHKLSTIIQLYYNYQHIHDHVQFNYTKGKVNLIIVLLLRYQFNVTTQAIVSRYGRQQLMHTLQHIYTNQHTYIMQYDVGIFVAQTLNMIMDMMKNKHLKYNQYVHVFMRDYVQYSIGGCLMCLSKIYKYKVCKVTQRELLCEYLHEQDSTLQTMQDILNGQVSVLYYLNEFQVFGIFIKFILQSQQTKQWLLSLIQLYSQAQTININVHDLVFVVKEFQQHKRRRSIIYRKCVKVKNK